MLSQPHGSHAYDNGCAASNCGDSTRQVSDQFSSLSLSFVMSSFIVKWVANRFLKDNQLTKFGVEDPYYEYIQIGEKKNGQPKYEKKPRLIPRGIGQNDLHILEDVKQKAYRYDMWFNALGLRFGWSNIVGLVPVVGAILTNFWSLQIYLLARKLEDGLPLDIQLIFFFNILVDFLLSLIPIVGDLIEIGYKANLRNYLLLEKHLIRVGEKNLGLISEGDVRPGFINDKVQPFVDDTLVPSVAKAGEQIKKFVNKNISSSVPESVLSTPTTQSTGATATGTLDKFPDDDARSVRSLKGTRRRSVDEN